jgi:hypothetical protein
MFCLTSVGLGAIRRSDNGGKPMRRSLDKWDRVSRESTNVRTFALMIMQQSKILYSILPVLPEDAHNVLVMERDRQLTGFLRGQSDKPIAPDGFELSNPWKVCLSSSIPATLYMVRKLTLRSPG